MTILEEHSALILDATADLFIEQGFAWVDFSGRVYLGRTQPEFTDTLYASDITHIATMLTEREDLETIFTMHALMIESNGRIPDGLYDVMLDNNGIVKIRQNIQRRFVEQGIACGVILNPTEPTQDRIYRVMADQLREMYDDADQSVKEKWSSMSVMLWEIISHMNTLKGKDSEGNS